MACGPSPSPRQLNTACMGTQPRRTLMVSMMWVCPLSTSTALLWLMSSNLTPLAARTWSPTRMPFCSASPPGSTLEQALLPPHTSAQVALCPSGCCQ
uniref:Uncharacterized protein n=1 Tax=Bubo bubo TaxID=30461 RepID=A0A8C0FFD6_BUBBB